MSKEFRYVVGYNTDTKEWFLDEFEFSDGNIWDSKTETWSHGSDEKTRDEYASYAEALDAILEDFNEYSLT